MNQKISVAACFHKLCYSGNPMVTPHFEWLLLYEDPGPAFTKTSPSRLVFFTPSLWNLQDSALEHGLPKKDRVAQLLQPTRDTLPVIKHGNGKYAIYRYLLRWFSYWNPHFEWISQLATLDSRVGCNWPGVWLLSLLSLAPFYLAWLGPDQAAAGRFDGKLICVCVCVKTYHYQCWLVVLNIFYFSIYWL